MNMAVMKALQFELMKSHSKVPLKGDVSLLDNLKGKVEILREISNLHQEALTKFHRNYPEITAKFPELHKELFSVELKSSSNNSNPNSNNPTTTTSSTTSQQPSPNQVAP